MIFVRPISRSVVTLLVGLCLVVTPSFAAETLTVATYNIENYTAADRVTEAGYAEGWFRTITAETFG